MRKRILATMLTLALMMSFTVSVLAKTKSETVTPELELLTMGTIYTGDEFRVRATTLKHGTDVMDHWTYLGEEVAGSRVKSDPNYINTVTLTAPATPGTVAIRYAIVMSTPSGNRWIGEGEIMVQVKERIAVEYKAAPAVAIEMLHQAGIKENYASKVANEMGPGTDFRGIPKEDVEAYYAAVRAFLIELGADLQ